MRVTYESVFPMRYLLRESPLKLLAMSRDGHIRLDQAVPTASPALRAWSEHFVMRAHEEVGSSS